MKNIKNFFISGGIKNKVILLVLILLTYLSISVYFNSHFFFNTVINGVDVSLKSYSDADDKIKKHIENYKLQLIERDEESEEILGQDIGMKYNENNSISSIYQKKNSLKWITSLLQEQKYYIDDLFVYNKEDLESKINKLNCLNKEIIEPKNVSFTYSNGSYELVEEVYGNKIYKDKLNEVIKNSILEGKTKLDLNENHCYENPRYTLDSDKTSETKDLLDKYIKAKITYIFGSEKEVLDGSIINQWINVDKNLDVLIDEKSVKEYVQGLGEKYDTSGKPRKIKTSIGKIVEVKGGFYGWKINASAETKALIDNIKLGKELEKEPIYAQKAVSRDKDDIGKTYVEINITRQHLWFYKNGKIITQGPIVTGNPTKGNSTKVGVYMLNYKQKESILKGADYEAEVTYWMPFNGNIGIHDANWRFSFGGDIYKSNGTHGCVNAPLYLAKTIFENIEDGTPIICYEE
ncbi:MAG: peptidoglycan binding domain-containing protein [Clostridiaceae bacterium]